MNMIETFAAGIAPEHVPALLAAILLPAVIPLTRRFRAPVIGGWKNSTVDITQAPSTLRRWTAWLLGMSAAVHLALPLGHFDGVVLALGYVGSGVAYAWLALRARAGRRYRLRSVLLLAATLIAYLVVSGTGGEEPDQVGIATALVELLALGLCLVPVREAGRPRRFKRFAGSTATIVVTFMAGVAVWIGTIAEHAATDAEVDDHDHAHDHAMRAQAGIIMRPQEQPYPTVDQIRAAQALADATKAAMVRYRRLDDAIAAGYVLPAVSTGPDVHIENPVYKKDGRQLDPQRPETLVYAIQDGRATLLGVVYVMEQAGYPAPQPGGPITRWHAHNLCLTLLPPGFGIVSPFGSCPALSLDLTTPEMMHVWVVDNPVGPFAEGLEAGWVRAYNVEHGLPYGQT